MNVNLVQEYPPYLVLRTFLHIMKHCSLEPRVRIKRSPRKLK